MVRCIIILSLKKIAESDFVRHIEQLIHNLISSRPRRRTSTGNQQNVIVIKSFVRGAHIEAIIDRTEFCRNVRTVG